MVEITDLNSDKKEILNKLQNGAFEILKQVDEICRKNDIKYSLSSGSLLGAVRHKGFIPWDDDMDISMTKENYDKFIDVCVKQFDGISLLHYTTRDNPTVLWAKVKKDGTVLIDKYFEKEEINYGINIDVFPVYRVRDKKSVKRRYRIKASIFNVMHCATSKEYVKEKRGLKRIGVALLRMVALLLGRKRVCKMDEKFLLKEHKKGGSLTTADVISKKKFMPYSIFEEYTDYEFNGVKFMGIKDADTYLKTVYGNYMELPPEDKRITHIEHVSKLEI